MWGEWAMEPLDQELYTTKELFEELMRRKTFLGVVIHSGQEMKGKEWDGERTFKVHFNSNLDTLQASRLLDTVANYLNRKFC
jgi:hypothetical protein